MMQTFGRVSVVAVGLTETDAPIVREYFGGPGVPPEITARYLRTPFTVDTPITRAVLSDEPVILRDEATLAAEFPALMADFEKIGFSNLVVIPLHRATNAVFGALAVGWDDPWPLDDMLPTLEEVATICARTAERLELLDLERSIAQTLQLGLLALDSRNTHTIVRARYQPADNTIAIGGDWYDAVDIGDGRTAVAVGDVVGRGLPAATTMGQLRAALGITALQADDAADAVRILDRYARHVPGAECATVAFAVVDPQQQMVSYACAGHVPPLLARPDGTVEFLEAGTSWPLGLDIPKGRPPAAVTSLPPGSLLLLYTDGLVERRGESLDVGLARLRAVVEQHWRLPLRRVKQAIFSRLVDGRADDDIALVALRVVGSTPEVFADVLTARHQELAGSRRRLRAWLEQHNIGEEEREAIVVAVSEAIANAVDHGSDDENQIVRVEATTHEDRLIVSVSDSGNWQPGVEGYFHGRGRGHLLMQSFAEAVDIDTDQHGTIVTLIFERERQLT
jgi:anti-sigma regulatory factor (Ser/Thr protein kinase)